MTTYIFKIITLLGGLSLFLFGMDVMGKALERQAGGKLQTILQRTLLPSGSTSKSSVVPPDRCQAKCG